MLDQALKTTGLALDQDMLEGLMLQPSTPLSDAPVPSPDGKGFLLALLLLAPKEPKGR
ncbi:hypothetical protein [Streptomyces odontomachi]|uniref:hypothetical protein n=1 Tax=Streptomyces odontomachi TaxID=2944940 RepID=UPI00210AF287|nr:hypothetical protein [Streptomyces sp. ODS25]